MTTLNKINDLFRKFRQGDLSPDEAGELVSIIKAGDNNGDLMKSMTDLWQHSGEVAVPSKRIFSKLQQQIIQNNAENPVIKKSFLIIRLYPFFKYAAVIVLSVGLTWLGKDFYSNNESRMVSRSLSDDMNVISVPLGSRSKLMLSDRSLVNLNSGSTMQYPSEFNNRIRAVSIDGEAYFDVKRNKHLPFYVKTRDITIKVLGTKFNVKSYSDEKTVETTLVSGQVEIYSNSKKISEKTRLIVLKPNQQARFEKQTGKISVSENMDNSTSGDLKKLEQPLIHKKSDLNQVIAWKDNYLVFRDENFSDLAKRMERWYDVEIDIQDDALAHTLFSGILEKETIEQALDALKLATPFQYKITKNKITITK